MKKLLGILIISFFFIENSYAKVGYFECSNDEEREINFKIDLSNNFVTIFKFDYPIYEISDRKIRAIRKGLPGDNYERVVTFDRYTGKLNFVAYTEKIYAVSFKCKKVSDKKIF